MKKEYKKPIMEIVPFALNEAVATGCKIDVYQNMSDASCEYTDVWNELITTLGDGTVNFTQDNGCTKYLEGYCYFTSSQIVFNS